MLSKENEFHFMSETSSKNKKKFYKMEIFKVKTLNYFYGENSLFIVKQFFFVSLIACLILTGYVLSLTKIEITGWYIWLNMLK